MIDRLTNFDIAGHNAEVKKCWQAVPDTGDCGLAPRFFIYNAEVNTDRLSFREYSENPDKMFDFQLRWQRWTRFNILQDAELGLPAKWTGVPDFQNYYESAWFGCEVLYLDNQVPDTTPAFAGCPERVMERGLGA